MTTLLYLSPQFPANFSNYIIRASQNGVKVLGIASDPYDALPEPLRSSLTEYWRVQDVHNYEEILWAAKELHARHGGIDLIESHTEFWFLTEARLRDALSVPGFSEEEAFELQKKSQMKELFKKAGVAVVPGRVVNSLREAQCFLSEQAAPIVLKPNRGVGATNTFKIDRPQDLDQHAALIEQGVFAERYISGSMLTFDGLVDQVGEIVYWTSFHYSKPVMELVNMDELVYYYTARSIAPDVEEAGRAYLHQISLRKKFFHIEFFRADDGTLYGLEANLRPPGGPTVDLWNYADNIDLYDAWAKIITGQKFIQPWNREFHVCYAGRKDGRPYTLHHYEVLQMLGERLVMHEPMSPLFRDAMGDYCYIFKSKEEAEMHDFSKMIHSIRT